MIFLTQDQHNALTSRGLRSLNFFELWIMTRCALEGFEIRENKDIPYGQGLNELRSYYDGEPGADMISARPAPPSESAEAFEPDDENAERCADEIIRRLILTDSVIARNYDGFTLHHQLDDFDPEKIKIPRVLDLYLKDRMREKYDGISKLLTDYLENLNTQQEKATDEAEKQKILLKTTAATSLFGELVSAPNKLSGLQALLRKIIEQPAPDKPSMRTLLQPPRGGIKKLFSMSSAGRDLIAEIEKTLQIKLPQDQIIAEKKPVPGRTKK